MLRHICALSLVAILAVGCGNSSGNSQITISDDDPPNNAMDAGFEDEQSVEDTEDDEPDIPEIDVPEDLNQAPEANAGADQSVGLGATVSLSAAGTSDPDGDELSFEWSQLSGTEVIFEDMQGEGAEVSFVAPTQGTTLEFEVVVSDGELTARDTVVVEVANRPPVAVVSPSGIDVWPGDEVILDARGSSDPDGDALEFTWEQAFGPEVVFEELEPGLVRFVAPEAEQVFMRVYVSDGAESVLAVSQVSIYQPPVVGIGTNPLVADFPAVADVAKDLVLVGDVLWVASSQGVVTYDVSEPASPVMLGLQEPEGWGVLEQHIDASGSAVVVANDSGLWTFDADVPEEPTLLDHLEGSFGQGLSVDGGVAYALGGGVFVTVDVSEPADLRPVEPGVVLGEDVFVGEVFEAHEGWLYGTDSALGTVWGYDAGLEAAQLLSLGYAYGGILDYEARGERLFVSTYRVPFYWGELGGESVSFESLYVGSEFPDVMGSQGLDGPLTQSERLVWVAAGHSVVGLEPNEAPNNPEVVTVFNAQRTVQRMAASQNAVFVLAYRDVSSHPVGGDEDPALSSRQRTVRHRFGGHFFGVSEGMVVVLEADEDGGLAVRGQYEGPMPTAGSDGGLLFVPDEEGQRASLWHLGAEDDVPLLQGSVALEQRQWPLKHVALSEQRAVLIWFDERVEVLDVSDPLQPVSMGFVPDLPEGIRFFQSAVWDQVSFIMVSNSDTYAVDASSAELAVVASVDQNGGEVRVVDGRVLVSDGRAHFFDWSDLDQPRREGVTVSLGTSVRDLDWDGRRLAVLWGSGQTMAHILEEDPSGAWRLKERYEPHDAVRRVWLDGPRTHLEVGWGIESLRVYQRPAAPSLVTPLPEQAQPGTQVVLEVEGIGANLFVGCEVSPGECAVTNIDRAASTAQVVWTMPQEPGFSSIALVAGEQRSFEVFARAHVRVR